MKTVLCSMLICLFVSAVAAGELASVAKVDLDTLEPLLLEVAFARPQNKELKEEHLSSKKKHDDMMKRIMESQRVGKRIDPYEMAGAMGAPSAHDKKKQIENLARAELILIIEHLYKDKYQLVISKTYKDSILYATGPIPDITASVKQHLLKQKVINKETKIKK
jgi:hypothetical protein